MIAQPEAAPPYQHVCPDVGCCYYGQPSFRGCGCYRTREQMMVARIEELTKALDHAKAMQEVWMNRARKAESCDQALHEILRECEEAPTDDGAWVVAIQKIARSALPLERSGGAT